MLHQHPNIIRHVAYASYYNYYELYTPLLSANCICSTHSVNVTESTLNMLLSTSMMLNTRRDSWILINDDRLPLVVHPTLVQIARYAYSCPYFHLAKFDRNRSKISQIELMLEPKIAGQPVNTSYSMFMALIFLISSHICISQTVVTVAQLN